MLKILLGVDESKSCNKAIEKIASLAELIDIEVVVITIVEDSINDLPGSGIDIEEKINKYNFKDNAAKKIANSCTKSLINKAKNVKTIIKTGNPALSICEEADNDDYDLIVVADLGKNDIKRFLLGNTAEKIVRHCKKSVLIVK